MRLVLCLIILNFIPITWAQSSIDAHYHPDVNHQKDIIRTQKVDERLRLATEGLMAFSKIQVANYKDGVSVPMYLFEPLSSTRSMAHPALVWVYGGIHDYFGVNYFPFIKEAVAKGYVVISPEYRGASGYGEEYYQRLDYGGMEVEDIITAGKYLRDELGYVDKKAIGVIGWSHGGYISLLSVLRQQSLFSSAVASVPVSNLIYRLSYKGPEYQALFSQQASFGGLPHDQKQRYLLRSPSHLVDKLDIPLMVQFATNDDDVEFSEATLLIDALNARKPELSRIIIYDDPKHGHYLNRQVDTKTLVRRDDQVQIDSWNNIWDFLQTTLKP